MKIVHFFVDLQRKMLLQNFLCTTTMTDQELRDLVGSLALDTQALKTQIATSQAEAAKRDEELAEERRKTEAEQRKTARMLRELGKQIGGLGNKFGLFTEGIAMPSVARLLFKRFGVEDFAVGRQKRIGADTIELDALGVVNGSRMEAYIVEVKSNLRSQDIAQLHSIIPRFREMFPEYAAYKVFGVLAVSKANENTLREAWQEGFYVIGFENHLMRFREPEGFVPTVF